MDYYRCLYVPEKEIGRLPRAASLHNLSLDGRCRPFQLQIFPAAFPPSGFLPVIKVFGIIG